MLKCADRQLRWEIKLFVLFFEVCDPECSAYPRGEHKTMADAGEKSSTSDKEPTLRDLMAFMQRLDNRITNLEQPTENSQAASGSSAQNDGHTDYSDEESQNDSRRERGDASAGQAGVESDPENESVNFDFSVKLPEPQETKQECEDILDLMVKDLHEEAEAGPPVVGQLEKIVRNRFAVKPRDNAIIELNRKYLFPENCKILEPPILNEQIKHKLNKTATKVDTWLSNIQLCVGKAAAAAVSASEKMHVLATEVAGKQGAEHAQTQLVKSMNETLNQVGDVIAFLGSAHQDLSVRRRYQLQDALPKDVQSVCTVPIKPGQSDKLFGEDLDKNLRLARESFRNKNQRYHPYRHDRGRGSSPFLGRGSGRPYRRPYQYQRGTGRRYRK